MAQGEDRRLVYRSGSARYENLTPRPGKDLTPKPGSTPGLSTFDSLELAVDPGGKAQVIDLNLLQEPLRAFPDRPSEGGTQGHVAIAPATRAGEVDTSLLEEWADTRDKGAGHPLTTLLAKAVVDTVRRPR
ncbi:hypothetical protein [Aquisphaera giovannonii]|uniref:hypothetical protein n=1 Tax=Aquisphaera giovannonii TaxID=406548 RepID=UPI0011E00E84|nr:hypothetical protein [Aquisphaera giovannonii]